MPCVTARITSWWARCAAGKPPICCKPSTPDTAAHLPPFTPTTPKAPCHGSPVAPCRAAGSCPGRSPVGAWWDGIAMVIHMTRSDGRRFVEEAAFVKGYEAKENKWKIQRLKKNSSILTPERRTHGRIKITPRQTTPDEPAATCGNDYPAHGQIALLIWTVPAQSESGVVVRVVDGDTLKGWISEKIQKPCALSEWTRPKQNTPQKEFSGAGQRPAPLLKHRSIVRPCGLRPIPPATAIRATTTRSLTRSTR